MSVESQASEALPSRRRRTPRGGRHRGAESFALPPDAPALVLAVPDFTPAHDPSTPAGRPAGDDDGAHEVAVRIANLTQTTQTGQPVRVGRVPGDLATVLAGLEPQRPDEPAAVVVPMTTGPHPVADPRLREVVEAAARPALLAQPLGPHPLMAQALHERLAEAGLARADRIRMMTMVSAAGGVIVAVPGDATAIRQAEASCVLLASRLAVPVLPASLDGAPGTMTAAEAADRLRGSGATHLALAPHLIGPETAPGRMAALAAEIGVAHSQPLGAHPALAQLVALRYVETLEAALAAQSR